MKGPLLNDNNRGFSTRNSLGIEDVAASIAADLCPVVNTVTPRAFYWPFMVWIYYDFYKYSGIKEYNFNSFNRYVKRQDFFFVLSQLLIKAADQNNLVGKDNVGRIIESDPNGPYVFTMDYFKSSYGGMQYYNAGCLSLRFVEDEVDEKKLTLPRPTQYGEKMAIAFAKIIENTTYYREYRKYDVPVPRDVLEEYGRVINLGLKGFDECKDILRSHMFELGIFPALTLSARYLDYIYHNNDMQDAGLPTFRNVLFDTYSVRGEKKCLDEELRVMSNGWEIMIGRQYFTCGIECIWKYMLFMLHGDRLTKRKWIKKCIDSSVWSFNLDSPLSKIIDECTYDFKAREDMITNARLKNHEKMSEDGLRVVLSMYNRFRERTDLGPESNLLTKGNDTSSISFDELIRKVDQYRNESIRKFLEFIMDKWLIEQHYITAYEKMTRSNPIDGFFYEFVDGYYSHKHDFWIDYQGIRLYRLSQVMEDLDML